LREKIFFIKCKEVTFKVLSGRCLCPLIFIEVAFARRQKVDGAGRAILAVNLRVTACKTILTHVNMMLQACIAGFFFRVVYTRCQIYDLLLSEA
jgi:hypothetical protein